MKPTTPIVRSNIRMFKTNLLLFLLIAFSFGAVAQNLTNLSYAEINAQTMAHYQSGNYEKAIPLMEAGMQKAKAEFGVLDSVYAEYVANLGFFYDENGQYNKAEPLYLEAKTIWKKIVGKDHPAYAGTLNNLAVLYDNMGRYLEAEPLYLECLQLLKNSFGKEHPHYALALNNFAEFYKKNGRYAEAEPLYLEAKSIQKKVSGIEDKHYAVFLNSLASLYFLMGRYAEAEPLYLEAKEIQKKVLGPTHPVYGSVLNNLALLYNNMQRYVEAEPLYLEGLDIKKKTLGINHLSYAHSLNNLALLYKNMARYKESESLSLNGIAILKTSLGTASASYIQALNNLTTLYIQMQRYKDAWNCVRQALEANSALQISLNIQPTWADSLANIPYSSMEEINYTLKNIYNLLGIEATLTGQSLATFQQKQIIVASLAMQLLKNSRDSYAGAEDKLRSLSETSDWTLRSLNVLSKTPNLSQDSHKRGELGENKNTQAEKAFEFAELNKSVLLMDAAKTERAYSFGDLPDSLVQQEQQLQKSHASLEAQLLENHSESEKDSLRSVLNHLNLNIKKFKQKIEKNYPKYAALKYEQHDANASEIQKNLGAKEALLEYVVGDSSVYIFYIDQQNLKFFEYPVSKIDLTEKIKKLHDALSNYAFIAKNPKEAYHQYTETAYWFYKNLVSIALANSKNIEHLIIVTDGELGFLPFETFLTKEAPQKVSNYAELAYLLNDYRISYNYSATIWKENIKSPKNTNNGQLFAMAANYEMRLDSSKQAIRLPAHHQIRKSLNTLPEANKEVEVLAGQFQGYFGLNALASEKIFKEKAADFGIIHLAMHGILDKKSPILSSLAFTEDGDSMENNFLQAFEISKMKLNADLVVLSACETGYGKFEKGNGIASLARAFMYAGASSLVVSLWQVNDFCTAEIMKSFYTNLSNGMDKAEALRQAKLDYLKRADGIAAHPAFWSPFIQLGDSRPIQVEAQFIASKTWWVIGGFSLLIFGAIFAFLRKNKK